MSLLDDVSIVVTPNGYKAGELYAVVPVPTEGAELVEDGSFPSGTSNWSEGTGWSLIDGYANASSASGELSQSGIDFDTSKRYYIQYTISGYSGSGGVKARFKGAVWNTGELREENGTFTEVLMSTAENTVFSFVTSSSFTGSISNVSVKEYTASDMDVTRATAATRVDENGLVNYAEVLGSELVSCGDFDCADPDAVWSAFVGWDINGGKAEALNVNGSNLVQDNITFTNTKTYKIQFSISDYVSGEVRVRFSGGAGFISTDYVSGNNTHTLYLQSIGNTVFRFQGQNNFTASIDNVSVKEVTRDNVPRIDYTGGGCPHILAEPQRTNLITYSEAFNSWLAKDYVTVAEDTSETTSPSGNNTASKITINSVSTIRRLYEVVTTSSGNDYTFTVYAKKGTTDYIRFYLNSNMFDVSFDLTNGTKTVTLGSGSIESVGNDWYRLQATGTSSLTTEVPQIQLSDSASVSDYLYIWGSQFEVGSYPTSIIPTSGSTVTRNQDIFTRDGIGSLINSTEGVLFVEMAALSDDLTARRISINDGSYNNIVEIGYTSNSNEIKNRVKSGGGAQTNMNYTAPSIISDLKIALKWKVNDFAVWVNGVEVATDTSGTTPIGLSQISFDRGDGTQNYFGKVKQLQVYDTALTDPQLEALTS